jgi:hypothetical protein
VPKAKKTVWRDRLQSLVEHYKTYWLSKHGYKQKIEKIRGTEDYLLKASGMRATHQLTEWIVGRLDRVEVLAPERFRLYVAEQVDELQKIYSQSA